ncbi:MAG: DUF3810 domain-containing protein [Acetatifactor muris]|nr:DUF3810 domain-containing protein [Acetatifactor muris]MCM1527992.1 DUF3810 domain-containing protein [Bacteroides sp.]
MIYIGIAAVTVLLNILAWGSSAFCDAYIKYVFPVWVSTYGRFMGIFPFSVGEWMLTVGILLVAAALLLGLVTVVSKIFHKVIFPELIRKFFVFCAWVVLIVCLVMTLNCSMLYHVSTFSEIYFEETKAPSIQDLLRVRNHVADRCNELSREVERDGRGYIVYPGGVSADGQALTMQEKAREVMSGLGKDYDRLSGFYPKPKPMFFSDFMCQQYSLGWYFPFSLEANYNKTAYVMNLPESMCHELAHLKGFIYEDEANFISYLACEQSDDIYFQYSGYLSVLGYLERDVRRIAGQDPEGFAEAREICGLVELLDVVYEDDVFVTEEEWERIEGKALFSTETVDHATDVFVDTTLKVNGVADGMVSYSRVVELLLEYYAQGRG